MENMSSARAATWRSCREKVCCKHGARDVTGADIVRISRTLAMEPWHFTQAAPAAADDPAGIVLDGGRRRVTLELANAAHGCVFLVRTLSGATACGLGDIAPTSCQIFPADPDAGIPTVRSDSGCPCREWTEEDLDHGELAEPLRTWAADRDHWHEVVARWNARTDTAGTKAIYDIMDFQRYLLEAQAAREAGTAWPGEK